MANGIHQGLSAKAVVCLSIGLLPQLIEKLLGMQIIGPRYGDAQVLAASAVFEQLRPWRDTYQLCADRPLRAIDNNP